MNRLIVWVFVFLSTACSQKPQDRLVGIVDGHEVRYSHIAPLVSEELKTIDKEIYDLKQKAFLRVAEQYLIEKAAKKEGLEKSKYFDFFKLAKDMELTDAEKSEYEKQHGQRLSALSPANREKIETLIKERRFDIAKQKLIDELRQRATVQFKLPNPLDPAKN